jgi:hypothetical protein
MKICRSYLFLTRKKAFATYRWRTHSRWQFALNPVVNSNNTIYGNVVSVPTEEHNIYIYMHTYFTTYPPSGVRVFNAARTVLHTLRECIHDVRKRPQDIFRSPRPRCAVVASRTADTQPLPYDRDCPQASLVLRGWVWDSHHPAEEYLPSYPVVGASLQNSKLHKINIESKTGLACHLLRLVLIWASKRILTTVFKNRTARDVLYSDVLYS